MKRGTIVRDEKGRSAILIETRKAVRKDGSLGYVWEAVALEDSIDLKIGDMYATADPTPTNVTLDLDHETYRYMLKPGHRLGYPEPKDKKSPFWKTVEELADSVKDIPSERREMSAVRNIGGK